MKIIFGAIVTDGFGKIGGHQIRRLGTTRIFQNKNNPVKSSTTFKNVMLPIFTTIFQEWALTTQGTRDLWITEATKYEFPDKFGINKNLTGRQFYTKLNIQTRIAFNSESDKNNVVSTIQEFVLTDAEINVGNQTIDLYIDNYGNDWQLIMGLIPLRTEATNPNPKKAIVMHVVDQANYNPYNAYADVLEKLGEISIDKFYTVVVWQINPSGFVSTRQSMKRQGIS